MKTENHRGIVFEIYDNEKEDASLEVPGWNRKRARFLIRCTIDESKRHLVACGKCGDYGLAGDDLDELRIGMRCRE